MAPVAGVDCRALGAEDERIDGQTVAEAHLDFTVDETDLAALAELRVGGRPEVIERGEQRDIAGIIGVGVYPIREGEARLGGEIELGGGDGRRGFREVGAPALVEGRLGRGVEQGDAGMGVGYGPGGGGERGEAGVVGR